MKHFYNKFAQLGALLLIAVIALYAYRQRQPNVDAAFLASLPTALTAAPIEFHGLHAAPSLIGNFLFFSMENAKTGNIETRYVPVKRNLWGQWRIGHSGNCSQSGVDGVFTEFADFDAHHLWLPYDYNSMTNYSVVCGNINNQAIQTVAVIWEDGTITQDSVAENRFIVVAAGRQPACTLQLFDHRNNLMQEVDLHQIDFVSTEATTTLPKCKNR